MAIRIEWITRHAFGFTTHHVSNARQNLVIHRQGINSISRVFNTANPTYTQGQTALESMNWSDMSGRKSLHEQGSNNRKQAIHYSRTLTSNTSQEQPQTPASKNNRLKQQAAPNKCTVDWARSWHHCQRKDQNGTWHVIQLAYASPKTCMVVYSKNAQALIGRNAIVRYVPHKQTITLKQTTNH
jgi:hypothetical protein